MTRLCERPGCSEPGAIAYGFDADRLLVWLIPLDPAANRNRAGVLCLRHADAMVVPIGWSLDDARDPTPRLFRSPRQPRKPKATGRKAGSSPRRRSSAPPAAADSEQLKLLDQAVKPGEPPASSRTVASVTGVAVAKEGDPDSTVAIPWRPDFDHSDDLGGVLDARSPLLGRAFRGGGRDR